MEAFHETVGILRLRLIFALFAQRSILAQDDTALVSPEAVILNARAFTSARKDLAWSETAVSPREIPSPKQLRAGSSLRLKSGSVQDDAIGLSALHWFLPRKPISEKSRVLD